MLVVSTAVIMPTITGDPQPKMVYVGQTAAFGVIATGTKPFTYQWQKNETNIPGATDSAYATPAAVLSDNGSLFRCIVANSKGADTSAAALLTVKVAKPEIKGEPLSDTVTVGQTATFGVIAIGTKPFSYIWRKNGIDISGAVDSSYTTPATTMSDNGALFKCIVANSAGEDTSVAAVLKVNAIKPEITGDPQSATVTVGQTATFGVIATGTKPFTYKWQKNGVNISGAIDSSYTTPATTMGDNNALFKCIVANGAGEDTSVAAVLKVNAIKPEITGDPQSKTVNDGQTAIFGVAATGTKPFTYKWLKNGVIISGAGDSSYTTPATTMSDNGALFKCIVANSAGEDTSAAATLTVTVVKPNITGDPQQKTVAVGQTATFGVIATGSKPFTYQWQKNEADISGAVDSSYTTPATVIGDSGSLYRCIVANVAGTDTSSAAVLYVVTAVPPVITGDPQAKTVIVGENVTFGVIATGTKPLTYRWQKNGGDIFVSTDSSYTTPTVAMSDSGALFRCIVSNSMGSDTSATALLTVLSVPVVSVHPQPKTVYLGENVQFTIRATGSRPFTFQWLQNNSIVPSAIDSTLNFAPSMSDSGSLYKCIVSNAAGKDTSNEALLLVKINTPPVFTFDTAQFKNAFVGQSYNPTISATDADGHSLHYSLLQGITGMVINPTTGMIMSYKPTISDTGTHPLKVQVTDSHNGYDTLAWTLRVREKGLPKIITQPKNDTVNVGETASFKVSATSTYPPMTFQWQKTKTSTFTNIFGATDSIYDIVSVEDSLNGTRYRCVVTDSAGSVTSGEGRLVILISPPVITADPLNQTVIVGDTAVFHVSAVGTAMSFQWQYDSSGTVKNLPSSNDSIYKKPGVTMADNGKKFRCIVFNTGGKDTSLWALLQVNINTPPVFTFDTAQFKNVYVGNTYNPTISATDADGHSLRYFLLQGDTMMSINLTTGMIFYEPTEKDTGTHPIQVLVEDLHNGYDTLAWTLCVHDGVVVEDFSNRFGDSYYANNIYSALKYSQDSLITGNTWFVNTDDSGSYVSTPTGTKMTKFNAFTDSSGFEDSILHMFTVISPCTSKINDWGWATIETNFPLTADLSNMDTITIKIKGTGYIRVYLLTRDIFDLCTWGWYGYNFTLPSTWTDLKIPVKNLTPLPGSPPAQAGWTWDHGKNKVLAIGFGSLKCININDAEIHIRYIKFNGVKYEDFGFTYKEP